MAFKKNGTKVNTTEKNVNTNTLVTITGKLIDVFEGDKYNYFKVNCDRTKINPNTKQPYYDTFSVKFDKNVDVPNDECDVQITATLSSFFDKSINRTMITIDGQSIKVSN